MDLANAKKRLQLLRDGEAQLKLRISALTEEREQRVADLHATGGAIQELLFWVNVLTPGMSEEDLKTALGSANVELITTNAARRGEA